jgi:type IV pilus assembly protein PilE
MHTQRGFSLVELLTVVAIVGILSAIAIPAYNEYTIRGKITDGTSNLATKRLKMEQYYLDNRTYAAVGALNPPGCVADTTTSQYFNFSCAVADGGVLPTATAYTIAAKGKGAMSEFTYTIDQSNAKASIITRPGWDDSPPCWVTKKGGAC